MTTKEVYTIFENYQLNEDDKKNLIDTAFSFLEICKEKNLTYNEVMVALDISKILLGDYTKINLKD